MLTRRITAIRGRDESAAIEPDEADRAVYLAGFQDPLEAFMYAREHGIREATVSHEILNGRGRSQVVECWRDDDAIAFDPLTDELDFN